MIFSPKQGLARINVLMTVYTCHRIMNDRMEKYGSRIRLHLKVALLHRIEESSSRREGRVSSRRQIV